MDEFVCFEEVKMDGTHKRWIDVLKGLAVIMIIWGHCNWSEIQKQVFLYYFWVFLAVPILMIITGYVYTLSYKSNGIDKIELCYQKKILIPRLMRYFLPYSVCFAIEVVATAVIEKKIYSPVIEYAYEFIRGGYGAGGYYFPVMIQVVFMFPFIYFTIKNFGNNGLLGLTMINLLYEFLVGAFYVNEECYRLIALRYIFVISFGCWIAHEYKTRKKVLLGMFFIGIIWIILVSYMGYIPIIFKYWLTTNVIATWFIAPLMYLVMKGLTNSRQALLEMIGVASYHIFLVQKIYFHYSGVFYYLLRIDNIVLQAVFSTVLCIVVGVVFYKIGSPISNMIVQRIKKWVN